MPQYEPFRISDIAPYLKLWAESNPNSPENLYQKQLRDMQMKQMILNLRQANQPQWKGMEQTEQGLVMYGVDQNGQPIFKPTGYQKPPSETQRQEQQRLEVLQQDPLLASTMSAPERLAYQQGGKLQTRETVGGFNEDDLRKSYISYKAGRTKQDPMTLLLADMARKAGNLTQANNLLTPPPDMDFKQYVAYITGENTTPKPTPEPIKAQPIISKPITQPKPTTNRITATNPKTGEKVYSDDGGKTWNK